MGHNAGKNRYRDDKTGGSAETYSRMERKKDLTVRHARPNWPISSRLRFLKNYCFALVD